MAPFSLGILEEKNYFSLLLGHEVKIFNRYLKSEVFEYDFPKGGSWELML